MTEEDILHLLLSDPNLLANERAILQKLLTATVTDHPPQFDAPAGNLEGMRGIVLLSDLPSTSDE